MIDVQDGVLANVSGRLHDSFVELGDSLVRLAVEVPEEAREDIPSGPEGIFSPSEVVGSLHPLSNSRTWRSSESHWTRRGRP